MQHTEVCDNHRADEDPQHENELTLGDQVGLTRLVDQLRDLAHCPVHGQVLQVGVDGETKEQAEDADSQAKQKQRVSIDPYEFDLR